MKDRHLIKYEIFCQRKKFSLKDYLKKNPVLSYEDIKDFFRNNKTQPPEKLLFDALKEEIYKENETKIENQKSVSVKKASQSKSKIKEPKKSVPRRRRKRKTNAN